MRRKELRRIATEIAAWQRHPSAAFTSHVPIRLLTDPAWREQHLLAPRDRIAARKASA